MLKEITFSVFFLQFIEKSLYFASYSFFVTITNGTSKKMKKQGTRY
ncbi:hydrolase, partial [Enterococcus faecium]